MRDASDRKIRILCLETGQEFHSIERAALLLHVDPGNLPYYLHDLYYACGDPPVHVVDASDYGWERKLSLPAGCSVKTPEPFHVRCAETGAVYTTVPVASALTGVAPQKIVLSMLHIDEGITPHFWIVSPIWGQEDAVCGTECLEGPALQAQTKRKILNSLRDGCFDAWLDRNFGPDEASAENTGTS